MNKLFVLCVLTVMAVAKPSFELKSVTSTAKKIQIATNYTVNFFNGLSMGLTGQHLGSVEKFEKCQSNIYKYWTSVNQTMYIFMNPTLETVPQGMYDLFDTSYSFYI